MEDEIALKQAKHARSRFSRCALAARGSLSVHAHRRSWRRAHFLRYSPTRIMRGTYQQILAITLVVLSHLLIFGRSVGLCFPASSECLNSIIEPDVAVRVPSGGS